MEIFEGKTVSEGIAYGKILLLSRQISRANRIVVADPEE